MSVRNDIPDTEQGIQLYVEYCVKQIDENKKHINRLMTRLEWCMDKAKAYGFSIKSPRDKEDDNA